MKNFPRGSKVRRANPTVWVLPYLCRHNSTCIHNLVVSDSQIYAWTGTCLQLPTEIFLDDSCLLSALLVQSCSKNWPMLIWHFYAGWLAEHWSGGDQTCRTCSYGPGLYCTVSVVCYQKVVANRPSLYKTYLPQPLYKAPVSQDEVCVVTEVSTFVFITQVTNDLKIEYSHLYIAGSRGHAWALPG